MDSQISLEQIKEFKNKYNQDKTNKIIEYSITKIFEKNKKKRRNFRRKIKMNDIVDDLFKIYLSTIDSYISKINQTVNDKYTIIDKSMLTVYLFIKIVEDRKEQNSEVTEILINYLLKQNIYVETGSLSFEISDESKIGLYNEILDKLILEKFDYKNRVLKQLKYNYKIINLNKYTELLTFLEDIAEFSIYNKMLEKGNDELSSLFLNTKNKIVSKLQDLKNTDYFYKEKYEIINLIKNNKFTESIYGNLINVALNLKDVYRYSSVTTLIPENVLFHQYSVTLASFLIAQYSNKKLNENIDVYEIILKALFHDFGEYKGTEIVTQFKNYNDVTKKMFAEIEENDEKELESKIGTNLYNIISNYKNGAEGFIVEMVDKMLGIMKLWIEAGYLNNYIAIKSIVSVYQDRFKRFLKVYDIKEIKNKEFYMNLLRDCYVYVKENLVEKNIDVFLKYFTEEELNLFRDEIKILKNKPEMFLK